MPTLTFNLNSASVLTVTVSFGQNPIRSENLQASLSSYHSYEAISDPDAHNPMECTSSQEDQSEVRHILLYYYDDTTLCLT